MSSSLLVIDIFMLQSLPSQVHREIQISLLRLKLNVSLYDLQSFQLF